MAMRFFYSLLLILATPLIVVRLLWRARRQPEYRQHWGERFGFDWPVVGGAPLIWVHAVSVGETRAAEPLLIALRAAWPDHQLLVTHMTPTGRDTAVALPGVLRVYLPYDYPHAVTRFLKHFRPVIGILMETEVWPNLMAAAERQRVPVVLANARLSERSLMRARRVESLIQPAMARLAHVFAQTPADAVRLRLLGANLVSVTGNLKFDIQAEVRHSELAQTFRDRIGKRSVLLAASTREGEEDALLQAFTDASALPGDVLLMLVPRHPQRFDEVARIVARHKLSLQRRSDQQPVTPSTRVWLGDSMGELPAYYETAALCLVGGSLVPLGGQNLIEACAAGCPAVVGPHTYNFTQVTEDALSAGAALRVDSYRGFFEQAGALLADPDRHERMRRAGLDFTQAHRGATERTVAGLKVILGGAASAHSNIEAGA